VVAGQSQSVGAGVAGHFGVRRSRWSMRRAGWPKTAGRVGAFVSFPHRSTRAHV